MSSPEYLRRHYGIVQKTGETPRISTPENLAKRTAAIPQSPTINVFTKTEKGPDLISLVPIKDPETAGIAWRVRKASGTRTVKKPDFMLVPYAEEPVSLTL